MEKIKLLYGDCLELMKDIPSGSVDMVLCDLPYGTTCCKWDSLIPFEPLWEQYNRVTKENAAIVLFSQMPFTSDLIQSNRKQFRYEWIWIKSNATGFLNAKKMPLKKHENILVFYKKLPLYNPQFTKGTPYRSRLPVCSSIYGFKEIAGGVKEYSDRRYPNDILMFPRGKNTGLHPTQKPVELLEYLIKTYTNERETVMDNTMGSGSAGVACVNTGRSFIGIEKDMHYFGIAQKRITSAQRLKADY
ncbi:MAG: site-specific DNA-methyltransferase [Treponema sp.]|nr:site-specific DNA-methyltransferase [Treponema sp.]